MPWLQIHAGQDHLQQYARRRPIDALVELIWNGLDAEADLVEVHFDTVALADSAGADLSYISGITITDNGHGITPVIANSAFPKLGDSWKRTLNGRTLNGLRPLHGRLGRGRLFAYSLGHKARWTSISAAEDGSLHTIQIDGDQDHMGGFNVDGPNPSTAPRTGTTVNITVEQGRSLTALTRDDVADRVATRLAAHLLGNPDITVRIEGDLVDPRPLIVGEPTQLVLADIPEMELHGREIPAMTIVDWHDDIRDTAGLVLCNESGASLIEVDNSAPPGNVRSTGYLRWSGWAQAGTDLQFSHMQHPAIFDAGTRALAAHVASRTTTLTATIVTTLKEEGAYPYPEEIADPVQDTERQLFDIVAVAARAPLRQFNPRNRKMTARLLQVALQERPASLDLILSDALSLAPAERDELAELLRFTSLAALVGAGAEVTRRLDLLLALRHFIYSPDVAPAMREVDQLHPLVRDNTWIFGEPWRLSESEAGLTTILRAVLTPEEIAVEADLVRDPDGTVLLPESLRGRVDLLLQRTLLGPEDRQDRLIVELKRPSASIGEKELAQVRRYARALTGHAGIGPGRWTFWLVGARTKDEIAGELDQEDRDWGHVTKHRNYDIWVTTWGRLLDQAERRFQFYREQLAYKATQDEAVARVRRRHDELLPPLLPDAATDPVARI